MNIGTGTSIMVGTGFVAEILDVSPPAPKRNSIQTSHMGTVDAHTFIPTKLVDWGELKFDMAFDPSVVPPIDASPAQCVITFPDAETWTFQGFLTGYEPKTPLEDKMTASVTVKVSGKVTQA
jgi:hypothetical protein